MLFQIVRRFFFFLFLALVFIAVGFEFLNIPNIYFYSITKDGLRLNRGQNGIHSFSPIARVTSAPLVFNSQKWLSKSEHQARKEKGVTRILWLGGSIAWGWPFQYDFEKEFQRISGNNKIELIPCTVPVASLKYLLKLARTSCSHYQDIDYVFVQVTFSGLPMPYALFYGDHIAENWYNLLNLATAQNTDSKKLIDSVFKTPHTLTATEIQTLQKFYSPSSSLYDAFSLWRYVENALALKYIAKLKAHLNYQIHKALWTTPHQPDLTLNSMRKISALCPRAKTLFYIAPSRFALDVYQELQNSKNLGYKPKELQHLQQYVFQLNQLKTMMAKEGLNFADLYQHFSSLPDHKRYFLTKDWHPNRLGYKVLTEEIWKPATKKH